MPDPRLLPDHPTCTRCHTEEPFMDGLCALCVLRALDEAMGQLITGLEEAATQ